MIGSTLGRRVFVTLGIDVSEFEMGFAGTGDVYDLVSVKATSHRVSI